MSEKIYGFKEDGCKKEVVTEEALGKEKTQSLLYIDDEATIEVTFKRNANVIECIVTANLQRDASKLLTAASFTGEMPEWACPDESFGKQELSYSNLVNASVDGYLTMQIYKNKSFTVMCANSNSDNESKTTLMQFAYIVDDNETAYTKGDVDGNGAIDIVDLEMIKGAILGKLTLTDKQKEAADMNGDGEVSSADYVLLKNQIASQYELGDVNMDGVIDENDVALVQQYVLGNVTLNPVQLILGDVNNDGEVTTRDAQLIEEMIANEEAE